MANDKVQMTLYSNVDGPYKDQNKRSNFKTLLSPPLRLAGKWSVALVDIQYPYTWLSVRETCNLGIMYERTSTERLKMETIADEPGDEFDTKFKDALNLAALYSGQGMVYVRVNIPPGCYANVKELCDYMHDAINNRCTDLDYSYRYSDVDGMVSLYAKRKAWLVTDSKTVLGALGFDPSAKPAVVNKAKSKGLYVYELPRKAERKAELPRLHAITVYTDIVEYQRVGNTQAPLLAVVPVKGTVNTTSYWAFQKPTFLTVSKQELYSIQILLCGMDGEEVAFESGVVSCQLEFRRSGSI